MSVIVLKLSGPVLTIFIVSVAISLAGSSFDFPTLSFHVPSNGSAAIRLRLNSRVAASRWIWRPLILQTIVDYISDCKWPPEIASQKSGCGSDREWRDDAVLSPG